MIKVIIAEDEMLVRIGLKHSINWNELGMEVIADVDNGQAAYQCFLEKRPQVIITDLKMPKMGGKELIEKIREIDQECIIIVISCVEDFEVVRGMIAYKIFDYLSKALMSMNEINGVLRRAKKAVVSDYQTRQIVEEEDEDEEDVFGKVLVEYLVDEKIETEEFMQNTKVSKEACLVMMVNKKFINNNKTTKQVSIRNNALRELFQNSLGDIKGQAYTLSDTLDIVFVAKKYIKDNEKIENTLSHIINTSKELLKVELKIVITHLVEGWKELKTKYQKNQMLNNRFYFIEKHIIWEEMNLDIESQLKKLLQSIRRESLEWMMAEKQKLCYGKVILEIVEVCREEGEVNYKQLIQDKVIYLANQINVASQGYTTEEMIQFQREIIDTWTLRDTVEVYQRFLEQVEKRIKENIPRKEEIIKALQYIEKNYNKEIGLRCVANYVNLSPNYFSTLFKKEMGKSFVDYIMNIKIEKAKELLRTNMLFYQIAEEVGFAEETYFSKMFKLKTGLSPREWKMSIENQVK